MITLYFYYSVVKLKKVGEISREMLARFEKSGDKNRQIAEEKGETSASVELSLLEFDKHSQTPNDAYAIRIRLSILLSISRNTTA